MIVKRLWLERYASESWHVEGWFLFGRIPLYIRDRTPRPRRNAHNDSLS